MKLVAHCCPLLYFRQKSSLTSKACLWTWFTVGHTVCCRYELGEGLYIGWCSAVLALTGGSCLTCACKLGTSEKQWVQWILCVCMCVSVSFLIHIYVCPHPFFLSSFPSSDLTHTSPGAECTLELHHHGVRLPLPTARTPMSEKERAHHWTLWITFIHHVWNLPDTVTRTAGVRDCTLFMRDKWRKIGLLLNENESPSPQ